MSKSGAVVLVTGSTKGIGKAIAKAFAENGDQVIINSRKEEDCRSVVEDLSQNGGNLAHLVADVSKEGEVADMVSQVKDKFGSLDVLVNNAGILTKEDTENPNWDEWDRVFALNMKGLAMCSYYFSNIMHSGSSILNMASVWGLELPAYDANGYAATKAGVINLTKSLAMQLAPDIRVNAIAPSVVATEMMHENDPETKKWLNENIPLQRAATPDEIAAAALFLSSSKASFITGEVLKVDGGLTLKI